MFNKNNVSKTAKTSYSYRTERAVYWIQTGSVHPYRLEIHTFKLDAWLSTNGDLQIRRLAGRHVQPLSVPLLYTAGLPWVSA
jgi:hypothetical protein